ncbi:3-oxoacyl-(acyl carrier protein) reductase [Syntrophotalea carbinolica DSM 2380]|uniref:3-oxoacyl-[acyl-carrier-protein] reductase n=1 Tax=Syntrophotalea carbinolica (strain DSM 2380 / NBRC 103641 / GraBd1) TaxID=338963 RepID=Q3A4M3_SYNC1|nr:3-oxoacyl-[acyl-carrier-protein] reductase [Syntrophotalea carbinolica]ABA88684.1 3-oxoacyl-(acyl carrier protein) reductase [Syntrophotalea carbinolica DSM 2380]
MMKDKVVVVTGASRGIGRAMAVKMAACGAKIVVSARSADALVALVDEIKAQGGDAVSVPADIARTDDVARLFEVAVEAFGRVDVLVNNAGITRDNLLVRMKDADWDAVLDTNLKGAFLCTRAAAKIMGKQRVGRIINISSVVGEMGNAGQANYCASKAGLIGMTKSVARELAKRNVTVNAVTPGFIVTEMTDVLSEKVKESLLGQIPLGRFGEAEDIVSAVMFLASDQAAYITGQVLGVNGGMYM